MFSIRFSSGVPQGSMLGPILFSVYIAPIGQIVDTYNGVSYHTYADDTQLFVRLKDAGCMTALFACIGHLLISSKCVAIERIKVVYNHFRHSTTSRSFEIATIHIGWLHMFS